MTLIEDVARLKELEGKATPRPWFVEDCEYQWDLYAVNHDLEGSCPPELAHMKDIFEQAHPWKLISADKNGYWPPEGDSQLIPALRNAAPALLDVLGAFQVGDAEILEILAEYLESNVGAGDPDYDLVELGAVRRLAAAAAKMEAKQE